MESSVTLLLYYFFSPRLGFLVCFLSTKEKDAGEESSTLTVGTKSI